jgi:hypothetical protein
MLGDGPVVADLFPMTRSVSRRDRPSPIRRSRNPAITSLGFTMFTFEGDWPVVVIASRNAMSALRSL